MTKSLLSDDVECIVCRTTRDLHIHHVYPGVGRRKISEREGCWCYLCARHHNMSNQGVHFDKSLDLRLKAMCQSAWEQKTGKSTQEFIRLFGRNYL